MRSPVPRSSLGEFAEPRPPPDDPPTTASTPAAAAAATPRPPVAVSGAESPSEAPGPSEDPAPLPAAEFAAFQRAEVARWQELVALTGIRLEG